MKNVLEMSVLRADLLEKLVLGMSTVLPGLFTARLRLQECERLSLVSTTGPGPACSVHAPNHPVPTTVSSTQRGHTVAQLDRFKAVLE